MMGMLMSQCLPGAVYEQFKGVAFDDLEDYMESPNFLKDFRIVGKYCDCGMLQYHSLRYCAKCGTTFAYTNQSIIDFYKCCSSEQVLLSIFEAIVHSEFFDKHYRLAGQGEGAIEGSVVSYFKFGSWFKIEDSLRRCVACDTRNSVG